MRFSGGRIPNLERTQQLDRKFVEEARLDHQEVKDQRNAQLTVCRAVRKIVVLSSSDPHPRTFYLTYIPIYTYADRLSGVLSDIYSGILSDILSRILSYIQWGIFSDILSGIQFYLNLSDIHSYILSVLIIVTFMWHSTWHIFRHFILHFLWHSTWHPICNRFAILSAMCSGPGVPGCIRSSRSRSGLCVPSCIRSLRYCSATSWQE